MGVEEFDGRELEQISDEAIRELVSKRYGERQTLEFKSGYEYKTGDDAKNLETMIELLEDISSFANASGGYLIVGIREDGKGKAAKFEYTSDHTPESLRRSIRSLCNKHIQDTPKGILSEERDVDGNKIVLVHIAESAMKPHMVILGESTCFVTRSGDGKHKMSLAEIRDAVHEDYISKHLLSSDYFAKQVAADISTIKTAIKDLANSLQSLQETEKSAK